MAHTIRQWLPELQRLPRSPRFVDDSWPIAIAASTEGAIRPWLGGTTSVRAELRVCRYRDPKRIGTGNRSKGPADQRLRSSPLGHGLRGGPAGGPPGRSPAFAQAAAIAAVDVEESLPPSQSPASSFVPGAVIGAGDRSPILEATMFRISCC